MASKKAPAKLPTLTLKKEKPALQSPVDTGTTPESTESDQTAPAATDTVKEPDNTEAMPKARIKGKPKMVVTDEMANAIIEAKRFIKDKMKKSEAAREVFDMLKGHDRRQVVHVFIEGCGLSKAGASTYYQNCKLKK